MCGDIVDELPLARSTVSQHLRELKAAGLIQGSIDGPSVCYCVNPDAMADQHDHLEGYVADADLGLGCRLPTEFIKIRKGDTVIDLGSGAGNDVFVARHQAGIYSITVCAEK